MPPIISVAKVLMGFLSALGRLFLARTLLYQWFAVAANNSCIKKGV